MTATPTPRPQSEEFVVPALIVGTTGFIKSVWRKNFDFSFYSFWMGIETHESLSRAYETKRAERRFPWHRMMFDGALRSLESLHRTLGIQRRSHQGTPYPIGCRWRLSRVIDSNVSRLSGREQLWIGEGWAARFGKPPEPADFGRSAAHTREQVRVFRASAGLLLRYHDAAYDRMARYLKTLTADDLTRQLDEPQYQPLPTVAVRLVSVLEMP